MKITNNIYLEELVSKDIFTKFGEKSIWFIDPRLPILLQKIRDHFGKTIMINNWNSGGEFNNRGFRVPNSGVGGSLSQHIFGRAADFNIAGVTDLEVDNELVKKFELFKPYGLTTIENASFTVGWTHCDMRTTNQETILIVNP